MSQITDINEFLPEGLSEDTVEKIFTIVDSTINDQVDAKVKMLESRVAAYLRNKVDDLKEQAMIELTEEHEVFRNAQLFESVRTLMSLELGKEDETSAVSMVQSDYDKLSEEFNTLLEQVEILVEENDTLAANIQSVSQLDENLSSKVSALTEEKKQLRSKVVELETALSEGFESSEKAVVVSRADAPVHEETVRYKNELLTEDTLRLSRD